jgi:hypothetical protein
MKSLFSLIIRTLFNNSSDIWGRFEDSINFNDENSRSTLT